MQNKKVSEGYMFLAIPLETVEESGIKDGEILQFTAEKGKITIETVEETIKAEADTVTKTALLETSVRAVIKRPKADRLRKRAELLLKATISLVSSLEIRTKTNKNKTLAKSRVFSFFCY